MKNIQAKNIVDVIRTGKVILIFHGSNCFNCKIMEPIFNQLEQSFPLVKFYLVNIDAYPQILQTYQISALPTLLPFRHGQKLPAIIGIKSFSVLKQLIDQSLNYA